MFGVITRSVISDFDILSGRVNIFEKPHVTSELSMNFFGENMRKPQKNIFRCDFVEKSITLQQKEYKTSKQNERMSY